MSKNDVGHVPAIFNKLSHFPGGTGIPNYWTSIECPLSIHKEIVKSI